jgi:hypothetical protein
MCKEESSGLGIYYLFHQGQVCPLVLIGEQPGEVVDNYCCG